MIRGRKYDECCGQLQSWKLEVQNKTDKQWVVIDRHENDPFQKLEIRTFPVNYNYPIKAIKLTQTGNNTNNEDYLNIDSLDIFGYISKEQEYQ